MAVLSSSNALIPQFPLNAAPALTDRSPPSVVLVVQAVKFPDSKLSLKIRLFAGTAVFVGVFVGVLVDVDIDVDVGV